MGAEGRAAGGSEWDIRALRPEDAVAITEILQESPEAGNWSGESAGELSTSAGGVGLVCESQGKVAGFLLGRQVVDEAEILNLGVMRAVRGKGLGGALVAAAISEFTKRGARRVYLEVRESNVAAIALYRALGFTQRGIRKGYYRIPDEAAVLMDRDLLA